MLGILASYSIIKFLLHWHACFTTSIQIHLSDNRYTREGPEMLVARRRAASGKLQRRG